MGARIVELTTGLDGIKFFGTTLTFAETTLIGTLLCMFGGQKVP